MSERFTEDEVVVVISRLDRSRLGHFIEADLVRPARGESGFVFNRVDIARLELLCDLAVDLELDETALAIVVSLIDQLHEVRLDLNRMVAAIEAQPDDLRARITQVLRER